MNDEERRQLALARLLFFSDGVFAIAITILSVSLIEIIPSSPSQLKRTSPIQLLYDIHSIVFLVSFLVIALIWIVHNYLFRYTELQDTELLDISVKIINLFLLFSTTMVPFTFHLVSVFNDFVSWFIFIVNIVITLIIIVCLGYKLESKNNIISAICNKRKRTGRANP
jgi:uncharacterized membrane protein